MSLIPNSTQPQLQSHTPATYPSDTVGRLLQTDLVTPKTHEVLKSRIAAHVKTDKAEPRFFTVAEFRTLERVCDRLIPQRDREHPVDLAGAVDHPLAEDEIGYAGFADAHGWQRIGLDRLAPFEPRAVGGVSQRSGAEHDESDA